MIAEQMKIEAAFDSFSSLLIVSVPMVLSAYLSFNPAIISLGPATSLNLIQSFPNHLNRALVAKHGDESQKRSSGVVIDPKQLQPKAIPSTTERKEKVPAKYPAQTALRPSVGKETKYSSRDLDGIYWS